MTDLLANAISKCKNGEYLNSLEYNELLKWASVGGYEGREAQDALATAKATYYDKPFQTVNYRDTYREERYSELGHPTTTSGCYLTTACIKAKTSEDPNANPNLLDHCPELRTLREWRDSYVVENYPDEIAEYYEKAPAIVEAIDALPAESSSKVYADIYENVIKCVDYITKNDYVKAYNQYHTMYNDLSSKFLT